jgi:FkbM family methyltransferase
MTNLHRRIRSGIYEFDEFELYVPPSAPVVWGNNVDEFILEKSKGNVFWDIGANIGFYSFYTANDASFVRAFEPDPYNYNILEDNANRNGIDNIKLHQVAVSDEDSSTELFRVDEGVGGINSLATDERLEGDPVTVDTKKIDSLVSMYEVPDFVKVDIEGAELKILKGASESLANENISWLIEVHSPRTGERIDRLGQHGGSVEEIYSILTDAGYEIYGYDDRLHKFNIEDDMVPLNWFATKDTVKL